jgi:hypoxanthine phosphoribosyltransferase
VYFPENSHPSYDNGDIQKVLLTQEQIRYRIKDIAGEISRQYEGKNLTLVGILKGAVVFLADLARYILLPVELDFMAVSSYGASTHSSGVVRILKDLDFSIGGKDVLIVEDIVDTGLTLQYLCRTLQARRPSSLRVCALLNKPSRRVVDVHLDYVGFDIPDVYVVGYGLDYEERYRQLPSVCVLDPKVYNSENQSTV